MSPQGLSSSLHTAPAQSVRELFICPAVSFLAFFILYLKRQFIIKLSAAQEKTFSW